MIADHDAVLREARIAGALWAKAVSQGDCRDIENHYIAGWMAGRRAALSEVAGNLRFLPPDAWPKP